MKLTALELLETYVSKTETHRVVLADYAVGIHCTAEVFFKKEVDGSVPWVISRVCDHAGGQLRFCDGDSSHAICPLHNWEFDFKTLSYSKIPNQHFEHITKSSLPFTVRDGVLAYETEQRNLRVPTSLQPAIVPQVNAQMRYISHASAQLTIDGFKILTDPWFVGECFSCGWWLKQPPKSDAWDLLAQADMLYISHNHPDHLHEETLAHARRDLPIVVAKFDTDAVAKPLRDMGFTHVHELEAKRLYRVNDSDLMIAILPTGDHRDDSALYAVQGDFSTVMTVDCVGVNQYVLPTDISLLMTNFASGASGWPLCYDVVGPLEERKKIVTKNRGNAVVEIMKYLQVTQPKAYMPYAGFFAEIAPRDHVILEYNKKNSAASIVEKVQARFPNVLAVNPIQHDVLTWERGAFTASSIDLPPLFTYDAAVIDHYLARQRAPLKHFDFEQLAHYFSQSEFRDAMILYLVLTDDDFMPVGDSLRFDFSRVPIRHQRVEGKALLEEFHALGDLGGYHHLLIKARKDSMWHMVYYGRPIEELTIGFQCRIDRKPDQHNAEFWQHYTTFGAPMLRRGEDHLLYKLLEHAGE